MSYFQDAAFGWRSLIVFSLACAVTGLGMFIHELIAGYSGKAIPGMMVFAGLILLYTGQAVRGLTERIAKLEERLGALPAAVSGPRA